MMTSEGLLSAHAAEADTQAGGQPLLHAQEPPITAAELVAAIRRELEDLDQQIRNHPYLRALRRRRVSIQALKAFPGHEYHTVLSDLRSMAQLVHRFGDQPTTNTFFNGILQGEFVGLDQIIVFGRKLGMTEADLASYEVTPEGFAYATFMAWVSVYGSAAAATCGILVNFDAWGHNCGVMSEALRTNYGFSAAETAFLDDFANLPSFEDVALVIIQNGLDHGVAPAEIRRVSRLYQAYEKMFWDAMLAIARGT
jgi:hypothetical protein